MEAGGGWFGSAVATKEQLAVVEDPNWSQPLDRTAAAAFVQDILQPCKKSPRARLNEELVDAIRIAVADGVYFHDMSVDGDLVEYLNEFIEGFRSFNSVETFEDGQNGEVRTQNSKGVNESWYSQGLHRLHSRRPFMTLTGFIGLCPSHVAVGDVVCVFYGSRTPYIVRPQRDGAYTLVGETYMHGIMYGEFLKGDPASEIFTLL